MLSIEQYKIIYSMLDRVSPVPYDCGSLCDSICCRGEPFGSDEDSYIYLLPGEKEYIESTGADMVIDRESIKEHDLPASWGKYVYIARCDGPKTCRRNVRPIQCRTFPIIPHLRKGGKLEMIYCDVDLPYKCPLIGEERKLSDDFIRTTHEAWKMLIEDQAIRDFVKHDSRQRDASRIITV